MSRSSSGTSTPRSPSTATAWACARPGRGKGGRIALLAAGVHHHDVSLELARPVAGLRAAAFLTAGMARVPFWKFILADAGTAAVSVPFVFAPAYFFTDQIGAILADVHRVERWLALAALIVLTGGVVVYVVRWNRRVPKAP